MSTPLSVPPRAARNILVLMTAGTAGSANIRAFDSALPQNADSLGVTLGQTGHFVAAYALAYGLFQLPFGVLGDRVDKLKLVRLLAAISAAVMLLTSLASSYPAMLALRLLAGAAASAVIPLTISYIGDTVPFAQRQMALAWNMTALTTGMILGQAAGGIIAELAGWQAIPVFVTLLYLPAMIGLRPAPRPADAAPRPALRPDRAMRTILSRPRARAVLGGAFLEGAFVFATSAYLGLSLAVRFGLSVGMVGTSLTIYALGSLANVMLVRGWPAHSRMRGHFTVGGLLAGGGLGLFALAPGLPLALAGMFVAVLGAAAVHNNFQTQASQLLPEARATGFATFATVFFLSQSLGGALLAGLVDRQGVTAAVLWCVPPILFMTLWFRDWIAAPDKLA